MYKVLVTHPIPRDGLDELFDRYDVYYPQDRAAYTDAELNELLPLCDGVLACVSMSGDLIRRCPRLRIISNFGAGYDRIDVDAADEAGIWVTNIPQSTTQSTAELAFALLICAYRRVAELDRGLRSATPENSFGMGKNMGHNLAGATLGIIGMGRIGQKLADMARAFDMRVVYHNRTRLPAEKERDAAYLTLDELLRVSDAVSINCPLTPDTANIIGPRELALMKPGAVLINTSRGGTVDYDALCDALESGRLAGAGLDVYPHEPHVPERLIKLHNVTLTPHVGTNTFEARKAMARAAAEHIIEALEGGTPTNVVNRHCKVTST